MRKGPASAPRERSAGSDARRDARLRGLRPPFEPLLSPGFCATGSPGLGRVLSPSSRSVAGAARGLAPGLAPPGSRAQKVGARSGVSAQTGSRAGRKERAAPSRESRRRSPRYRRPARGDGRGRTHGRAPSSGGRARASARTMTRSPLAAAPSQPAGKPISHSGRQSPAAWRFVPRGPGRCH